MGKMSEKCWGNPASGRFQSPATWKFFSQYLLFDRSCHLHDGYEWISYGNLAQARSGSAAVTVRNGSSLLVLGGMNYEDDPLASLTSTESVDFKRRVIQDAGIKIPVLSKHECVAAVDESRLYLQHGRHAYLYDLDINLWGLVPQPKVWREGHVCGLVRDSGEIVVAGGSTDHSVEIFSSKERGSTIHTVVISETQMTTWLTETRTALTDAGITQPFTRL